MGVKEVSRKEGKGKKERRRFSNIRDLHVQGYLTFAFRGVRGTEMERTGKRVQVGGMAMHPVLYDR